MAAPASEIDALPSGTRRVGWIDIARGIGITLIIIGHLGIIQPLVEIAFSVHVPLFLLVSGYLVKPGRTGAAGYFARRLLIPYCVAGIIGVLAMTVRAWLEGGVEQASGALVEWLAALAFGSGTRSSFFLGIHQIGSIWFLLALFLSQLAYEAICGKPYAWPVVIALFALGYLTAPFIWLPWSIQSACVFLLFIHIGHEARERGFDPAQLEPVPVAIAFAIWIAAIAIDRGTMFLVYCYFACLPIDLAGAIAGTVAICWASSAIDRFEPLAVPLRFMGRNSLAILCFHFIECRIFSWLTIASSLGLGQGKKAFAAIMAAKLAWSNTLAFVCTRVPLLAMLFGAAPVRRRSDGR